jgi:OmcA/MtrC family decaheme c-type cytochrome
VHTPQTVDPDTGNSMDMPVLIHKIHMGSQLPSVRAGKPYRVIGFQQRVFDYSTVVFPADARNCTFCHEQNTGAAQASAFLKPNRAACGACHDNVNFETGENHANLPQLSDNMCSTCHIPQGELEFDLSISGGPHDSALLARSAGRCLRDPACDGRLGRQAAHRHVLGQGTQRQAYSAFGDDAAGSGAGRSHQRLRNVCK